MLCNKRSHRNEKLVHHNRCKEWDTTEQLTHTLNKQTNKHTKIDKIEIKLLSDKYVQSFMLLSAINNE